MKDEQSDESAAVVRQAMRSYHHDAEFHAEVEMTARLVDADQRERTDLPLAEGQRDAVRLGALVALHLRNEAADSGSSQAGDASNSKSE